MSLLQRIASSAARLSGRTAPVHSIESLSSTLVRIRFASPELRDLGWSPGDKIKLAFPNGAMRSYTPFAVDEASGSFDVVFHLHGGGPASHWAADASVGDDLGLMGPARSMGRPSRPAWALFYGDETTLGLAAALLDDLPPDIPIGGAIELASADRPAVSALGLPLAALARTQRGEVLLRHAEEVALPKGDGVVWLSGEASTVRALRNLFLDRGVGASRLLVKPYWSDRGHRHRKQVERSMKAV